MKLQDVKLWTLESLDLVTGNTWPKSFGPSTSWTRAKQAKRTSTRSCRQSHQQNKQHSVRQVSLHGYYYWYTWLFFTKGWLLHWLCAQTKANGLRKPPTKAGGTSIFQLCPPSFHMDFSGAQCKVHPDRRFVHSYKVAYLPILLFMCLQKLLYHTLWPMLKWSSLLFIIQPGHFEDFHRLDTRLRIIEGQTQLLGPQVEVAPINCLSFDGDFSERTKLQKLLANTQNDFKRQSSLLVQRFESLFPCFLA